MNEREELRMIRERIEALTAQIDQADAAIKRFLATTPDEEIELLTKRYINMSESGNAREVLESFLCTAALVRGMRDIYRDQDQESQERGPEEAVRAGEPQAAVVCTDGWAGRCETPVTRDGRRTRFERAAKTEGAGA